MALCFKLYIIYLSIWKDMMKNCSIMYFILMRTIRVVTIVAEQNDKDQKVNSYFDLSKLISHQTGTVVTLTWLCGISTNLLEIDQTQFNSLYHSIEKNIGQLQKDSLYSMPLETNHATFPVPCLFNHCTMVFRPSSYPAE